MSLTGDEDDVFLIVRNLARERDVATLATRRSGQVVLLAEGEPEWGPFRAAVERALRGGRCQLGVGASWGSVPEELGVYRFLSSLDDLAGLNGFVEEQLGPVLRHDDERNGCLAETLHHWLEGGGSNAVAARALMVHPSTVKYRMQRVREVGGYDLARPETRFTLQFATRGWHLLRALGTGR